MNKSINFQQIKHEFVRGNWIIDDFGNKQLIHPTIKDLAEKYKCSENTLYSKSSTENWKLQKEQYQEKIEEYYEEQADSERLALSAKYDAENIRKIEKVDSIVDYYLKKYEPYFSNESETLEEDAPSIELKDLDYVASILQKQHKLVKDIFGEYDSADKNKNKSKSKSFKEDNKRNDVKSEEKIVNISKQYEEKQKSLEEIEKEERELKEQLGED